MHIVYYTTSKTRCRLFICLLIIFMCCCFVFVWHIQGLPGRLRFRAFLKGKVIVLDPGHGGYDPGVMKNGIEEKEIVLKIAFKLRDYLQAAGALW